MSSEVKIGILAVVAIFLSFWGFKYIQGKNLLTQSNIYYVYYDNVGGLQVGTPVRISGLEVGSVSAKELQYEDRKVKVTLDLRKDINIPNETVAAITTTSFMGGKAIDLEFSRFCEGADCAPSGSTLPGRERGMLASMLGEDVTEGYMNDLTEGLTGAVGKLTDDLLGPDSQKPTAVAARDFQATMTNLKNSTARLDRVMQKSSGDIEASLASFRALAQTLEGQKDNLANILANADTMTQQLVAADLEKTMNTINEAIGSLNGTLTTTDETMQGLNAVVGKVRNGEGTLGQLLNDEELYQQLTQLSVGLDSFINDLQQHPYRYVPLKGRKRVLKYDRKDAELAKKGN